MPHLVRIDPLGRGDHSAAREAPHCGAGQTRGQGPRFDDQGSMTASDGRTTGKRLLGRFGGMVPHAGKLGLAAVVAIGLLGGGVSGAAFAQGWWRGAGMIAHRRRASRFTVSRRAASPIPVPINGSLIPISGPRRRLRLRRKVEHRLRFRRSKAPARGRERTRPTMVSRRALSVSSSSSGSPKRGNAEANRAP